MKNFIKISLFALFVVLATGSFAFSGNQNPFETQVVEATVSSSFVFGCTDDAATNYDASADFSDNSCEYPPVEGCTDIFATNYDIRADKDDDSCEYPEVEVTSCDLTASAEVIEIGGDVTLSWETEGYDNFTLNGQSVSDANGSKTFSNVLVNTTYTFVATSSSGDRCQATVYVQCIPPVVKECELEITKTVNKHTAMVGEEVTYTIKVKNVGDGDCTGGGVKIYDTIDSNLVYKSNTYTSNFTAGYGNKPVYTSSDRTVRFNGNTLTPGESGTIVLFTTVANPAQCGDFVVKNQSKTTAKELHNFNTWVYSETVKTNINNDCVTPLPKCDYITATPQTLSYGGGNVTLKWETTDATSVSISGVGSVALDNTAGKVVPITNTTTFVLTATNTEGEDTCAQTVTVQPKVDKPLPVCDSFTASPNTITVGGTATLRWETTNAVQVLLNNGLGAQTDVDGEREVSPVVDTTYILTVISAEDKSVDCSVPVTVAADEVPVCQSFTASPSSLPVGGGNVNLAWEVTKASNVSITPTIGAVGLTGNRTVNVTEGTTFELTATDSNGDETTCLAPVTVADPLPVFTCENNVNFSVSDSSIRRGDSTTLNWSTSNVDTLIISHINENVLSGSESVSPSNDITYTLTATQGNRTISCPVSVDVSSGGGGGGGSSSPRCELEVSDDEITAGEEITLRWDTSRATEVTIEDNRGNLIFTTGEYLARDKEEFFDGSIKVAPTRDTQYILTAERGSRDEECEVEVEVEDEIVVLQDRDQQPLVTGISLTQVPYTGFEAGPFMTTLFYALLVAWSLFITYLLIIRNRVVPSAIKTYTPSDNAPSNKDAMKQAESIRPDVFAPSVMSKVTASQTAPANLPTGIPVAGQDVMKAQATTAPAQPVTDTVTTELENRAHSQKALLSSDAVRHFVTATKSSLAREETLDTVIAEARKSYPLEDGWLVLNQARMQSVCEACAISGLQDSTAPTTVPAGTGSLAEAIVTGNVVAAYEMIGKRPMFALADAAADLDAVYRNRKGENTTVSDMLIQETKNLSDEQITEMIAALTGALDGTYTDESSAVKMSIMKAVKVAGA